MGIAITLFTLGVNITLYDGWFVITWSIIWINLVIWFRSVRYIPIFILRYAIICVPFTLAIDAILFDTILDEASADLMAGGLDAEEPSNLHAVDPHEVSGYETEDGTMVEGYYRDGDGNTDINLSKEDGGGYLRSNPDGDPSHNLHS
ncbi:hypothetical protein [Salibacterium qingdaonense]|uniref:hypothetical protein n=1 Tax=Salibacterium qingdaonense TaxID=266892 RepID=UPI001160DEC7|nr:hypothetical protein [Salibacterium qingdaonense]